MPLYKDQTGYTVELSDTPKRIVSLVPSQSEYLFDLGLAPRLKGVTKFCVHPEGLRKGCKVIGGTKNLKTEMIREIAPDLIIANKEENVKEQIEELRKDFRVWTSDVNTLDDALKMMHDVAHMTGSDETGGRIISEIKDVLHDTYNQFEGTDILYLIWKDPYMAAGKNTFIGSVIQHLGFINLAEGSSRYPVISEEDMKKLPPRLCLLSSEPYPFKDMHQKELNRLFPSSKVILTDGEIPSWYGSRMLKLGEFCKDLKRQINS